MRQARSSVRPMVIGVAVGMMLMGLVLPFAVGGQGSQTDLVSVGPGVSGGSDVATDEGADIAVTSGGTDVSADGTGVSAGRAPDATGAAPANPATGQDGAGGGTSRGVV